jgi:inner membrane protein
MDSITHIALGACIGEAFFEKGFGKKAMFWGALAQSIPDIDFVAGFWMDTAQELLSHRGFTHSFLFGILVVPVFALLADRIHRPHDISFKKWLLFFGVEVFLHLFLDGFNNYGIGWLEPFSHHRFSFNTIYVADVFFSLWPGIACVMLLILGAFHPRRTFWWRFGVILPFVYLSYCTINKISIDREVRKAFVAQHIPYESYFTTPAPLNNWLWFVVAGNDSGFHVGFRSVFDRKKNIDLKFFPRNDSLLAPISDHEDLQHLIRFSQGFYTVEKYKDTLLFNDLRFGQIIGWHDPKGQFVFHYYLEHPQDNQLVVQRGRFAGWNKDVFYSLLRRVKGN